MLHCFAKCFWRKNCMINTSFLNQIKNNIMKLGISKYKIIEELPEYLERRLNMKNNNE